MSFLAFLVQGIPVIGKAFDAFTNYTNKKMDTEVEKLKVNGTVDLGVIEARSKLLAEMKEDPATKWGRRLIIYPYGTWFGFVSFYNIFKQSPWGSYTWIILDYPAGMQYIGYAIIAYLFATAWRK